jgi:hypothetical protein
MPTIPTVEVTNCAGATLRGDRLPDPTEREWEFHSDMVLYKETASVSVG